MKIIQKSINYLTKLLLMTLITTLIVDQIPYIEFILRHYIKDNYNLGIIIVTISYVIKYIINKKLKEQEINKPIMKLKKKHILSFATSVLLVVLNLWTTLEKENILPQYLLELKLFAPLNIIIAVLLAISLTPEGFATFSNPKALLQLIVEKSKEQLKTEEVANEKTKLLNEKILKENENEQ